MSSGWCDGRLREAAGGWASAPPTSRPCVSDSRSDRDVTPACDRWDRRGVCMGRVGEVVR